VAQAEQMPGGEPAAGRAGGVLYPQDAQLQPMLATAGGRGESRSAAPRMREASSASVNSKRSSSVKANAD